MEKSEKSGEAVDFKKLTVSCGTSAEMNFVSLRDTESVFEEQGFDVSGLYVKLLGQSAERSFSLDNLSPDGLSAVDWWVSSVPAGAIVLMAIVGIESEAFVPVLKALAPLGVPQACPPPNTQVLACISMVGAEPEAPSANHASPDIAYASLLYDPTGS